MSSNSGAAAHAAAPRRSTPAGVLALFLGPFLVFFLLVFVAPIGYALYRSVFALRRDSAYGPAESVFVGLANYVEVLQDAAFWTSMKHILQYGVGPSLALIVLALVLSLLIDARNPGVTATAMRFVTFAPYAVPAVIGAILWGFLYAPSTSPFLQAFAQLGITGDPRNNAIWAVGNVAIWTYVGFNILIFLSQLSTVSPAILESARIDGAGQWRIAWSIKIPALRPAIVLSLVFNIIGTLQLFTEPTVLKPISNAITSGWTPNMLAYSEAAANRYSYSATVSVVLALATAALSFTLLHAARRGESDS